MKIYAHFVKQCAIVFLLPITEVFFIHHLMRQVFGRNNFVLGMYSRDVYIPALIGGIIGLWYLQRQEPMKFRLRLLPSLLNLASVAVAATVILKFDALRTYLSPRQYTFLLLLPLAAVFLTGFNVFLPLAEMRRKTQQYGRRVLYAALATLSLVSYPILLQSVWRPLASSTGWMVYQALSLLGLDVHSVARGPLLTIHHPDLIARISISCAGLEGIFFFIFTFSLLCTLDKRLARGWRNFVTYGVGIGMMFLLNVVRITVFFVVAAAINRTFGGSKGSQIFIWAFHSNLGWILYFGALGIFFAWLLRAKPEAQAIASR